MYDFLLVCVVVVEVDGDVTSNSCSYIRLKP